MTRKTTEAYRAVFKKIREVAEFPELQILLSDFELGMRVGFVDNYENVRLVGCNVHYDRVCNQFPLTNPSVRERVSI